MNNSLFMRSDAKPTKFLKSIARDDITQKEVISNPLMKEYKGDDKDEKRINETNILGNIDSGRKNLYNNIGNTQPTLAQTDFGKACFKNGVDFFDIFTFEVAIDYQLRDVSNIENVNELIDIISNCILTKTYNPHKKKWIYDVFINGVLKTKILRILMSRSSGEFNFANLVARDISLWKEKLRDEKFYIAYVGKIGDCDRRGGKDRFNNYHRFEKDKYNLMASYAVSLEKENLDNIDYNFMPIVDTLNDLNKVEKTFYKRLKYGTDDDFTIKLIQLGLDLSLAKIITDTPSFRDLFSEDGNDNLIYCTDKDSLVSRMLEKNMPVIYIKLVSDLL